MRPASTRNNFYHLAIGLLLVAAVFLLLRSALWRFNASAVVFTDDFTVTLAVSRLLLNGEHTLLGPPCHVAGRHLSPIYYWYQTAIFWIAQQDVVRTAELCTMIKLATLGIVLWALRFFLSCSALWIGRLGAILILCSGQFIWVLRKPWHMHFMLLPATAIFVAAFLCIVRGPRYFLPFVLCAFLLVQTHFGAAPMAVGLAAVLGMKWLWEGYAECRSSHVAWRTAIVRFLAEAFGSYRWIWGVLAVASWAPLALYEMRYPSNLLELFEMKRNQIAGSAGLEVAWSVFYQFYRRLFIGILPVSDLTGSAQIIFRWSLIALLLGSTLILGWRYLREASGVQRWCVAALVVPSIAMFLALFAAKPPVYIYYLNSLLPVPPLVAGILLGQVGMLLKSLQRDSTIKTTGANLSRLSTLTVAIAFLSSFGYLKFRDISRNIEQFRMRFLPIQTLAHAQEVATVLAARAPAGAEFWIQTHQRTSQNKNGYLYLRPEQPLSLMKYSKYFRDMPSFASRNRQSTESGGTVRVDVLVMCPPPSSAWQSSYERGRGRQLRLKVGERWPVPSGTTHSECEVIRLVPTS